MGKSIWKVTLLSVESILVTYWGTAAAAPASPAEDLPKQEVTGTNLSWWIWVSAFQVGTCQALWWGLKMAKALKREWELGSGFKSIWASIFKMCMLVGVHPVPSGTAVHFLSNEMGVLVQFSEVIFLWRVAQKISCRRFFWIVLSTFYTEMQVKNHLPHVVVTCVVEVLGMWGSFSAASKMVTVNVILFWVHGHCTSKNVPEVSTLCSPKACLRQWLCF